MVRQTVTYTSTINLLNTIVHGDFNYMRRYSSYSKPRKATIKKIADGLLNIISGGDKYSLLDDMLQPTGVAKLYPCNQIIRDLATATNEWTKQNRKCQYLQFLAPHFSKEQCKKFGVNCSWRSHGNARDWYNITNGGNPHPYDHKLGGRFNEVQYYVDNSDVIKEFLYRNSRVAASRYSEKKSENIISNYIYVCICINLCVCVH